MLLGKRRDDEVTVQVPGGSRTYVVVAVRYEEPTDFPVVP
jgi:transcription elongation GreA/GreB family factor